MIINILLFALYVFALIGVLSTLKAVHKFYIEFRSSYRTARINSMDYPGQVRYVKHLLNASIRKHQRIVRFATRFGLRKMEDAAQKRIVEMSDSIIQLNENLTRYYDQMSEQLIQKIKSLTLPEPIQLKPSESIH
jgi:hypothetical protein